MKMPKMPKMPKTLKTPKTPKMVTNGAAHQAYPAARAIPRRRRAGRRDAFGVRATGFLAPTVNVTPAAALQVPWSGRFASMTTSSGQALARTVSKAQSAPRPGCASTGAIGCYVPDVGSESATMSSSSVRRTKQCAPRWGWRAGKGFAFGQVRAIGPIGTVLVRFRAAGKSSTSADNRARRRQGAGHCALRRAAPPRFRAAKSALDVPTE